MRIATRWKLEVLDALVMEQLGTDTVGTMVIVEALVTGRPATGAEMHEIDRSLRRCRREGKITYNAKAGTWTRVAGEIK